MWEYLEISENRFKAAAALDSLLSGRTVSQSVYASCYYFFLKEM